MVLGGAFFAYSIVNFCSYVMPRFLGDFCGRFRQSPIFTLIQLVGTGFTWKIFGALSTSIIFSVIGGYCIRNFLENITYTFICIFGSFILASFLSWCFFQRYRPKKEPHLPPLPADAPVIRFNSSNPELTKEFEIFEAGFRAIYLCLRRNLQVPFGKIKTWFAIPGSKYPAAYLWDSCFISGAWRIWDSKIAQEILRPFLDLQDGTGMCPQTIAFGRFPNYSITNPPLLAFAFLNAARMTGNYDLPLKYLPQLQAFEKYFEDHRQSKGLFQWIHSYESGLDNSPRFTDTSEKHKRALQSLWAVDLNVWMILLYQAMAEIIRHNNRDDAEGNAIHYDQKAQALLTGMMETLWDSRRGLFLDYDYVAKQSVNVNTIASLFPLALSILPDMVVNQLVNHVENPQEYNTCIPLPTVARNDPSFSKDTWRGPVWINTAWTVIYGLGEHQKNSLASDLAYRLIKGVYETYANCGSFYEFYDPDASSLVNLNRKKGNVWKQVTLGNKPIHNFCGWTAVVNTLFLENVLGYRRTDGKTTLEPKLPKHWRNVTITVKIPQFNEDFEIIVPERGELTIKQNNG